MYFDPAFRDDLLTTELWRRAMIPLRLPEPGRYGTLCVVHKITQLLPLFGQQLLFSAPIVCTLLYENETLWMSDTPQERLMMLRGTSGMRGHVLVAGGGLGTYPQYLCRYRPIQRITVIERHPDVVAMLHATLDVDSPVEIVQAPFEAYIEQISGKTFDGCYIDIHPTLDPRWLPWLNWLRNRCAEFVNGPMHIWGYHWMVRELVQGFQQVYMPRLRCGLSFDEPLYQDLLRSLPSEWQQWPESDVRDWLIAYACRVAGSPQGDVETSLQKIEIHSIRV